MTRMQSVLRLMSEANGTGCIYIEHDDTSKWGSQRRWGMHHRQSAAGRQYAVLLQDNARSGAKRLTLDWPWLKSPRSSRQNSKPHILTL